MKQKSSIREWTEVILIALVLTLVIRSFLVQPFKIPTASMRPTLKENDRIMVNKFIYGLRIPFTTIRIFGFRKPQRGEVIVFNFPPDPKRVFIKRVIATAGEIVEIKDGKVHINSKQLNLDAIKNIYYYNRGNFGLIEQRVKVPKDSYYVLGDNSRLSRDSRYWGFVNEKYLIGRAFFIYWPPKRIGFIK